MARDYIECDKKNEKSCVEPDDVRTVLEISNKRSEINAKFASTLQMVTLYFGPKTKEATNKLASVHPWWAIGEFNFRWLINAMNEELNYNITHNNGG